MQQPWEYSREEYSRKKDSGPVWDGLDIRIRSNNKLNELFNEVNVVQHINIQLKTML